MNSKWTDVLRAQLPAAGTPLLVAVSGGCDSMFLLHCLLHCGDWPLRVFHLDHQLRADSAEDAQLVTDYCQQQCIEAHIESCDIQKLATERTQSIETVARDYRYQRLREIAACTQIQNLLTAHHQDDQVETILMHIFRGSSVFGHGGMAQQRATDGVIIQRPFLQQSRASIRSAATAAQISWREDSSNLDTQYRRNFFRHQVVPAFEKNCPGFSEELLRWSTSQSALAQSYDRAIDGIWDGVSADTAVTIEQCLQLSTEQRGALWRRLLLHMNIALSRLHIRRLDNLIDQQTAKKVELSTWVFIRNRGSISWKQIQDTSLSALCVGVCIPLDDGCIYGPYSYQIFKDISYRDPRSLDSMQAIIHADEIQGALCVRTIEVGEKWQAFAAPGHKKIVKYLADKHLPADERSTLMVIADDSGVIWIPGYSIAQRMQVNENTSNCMLLQRMLNDV